MKVAEYKIDGRTSELLLPFQVGNGRRFSVQVEWTGCYPSPTGTFQFVGKSPEATVYANLLSMDGSLADDVNVDDNGYYYGSIVFENLLNYRYNIALKYTKGAETEGTIRLYVIDG